MSEYQRLLLVAPSEMRRTPAFERAAALASAKGAALHIVAFDYVEAIATTGLFNQRVMAEVREGYLQRHRLWLEDEAELQRSKGLTVTTEVLWVQQPYEEILVHVKEMQADMLIKDAHQEPALKRAFVTPLDWQLLRDCPTPLHLVTDARHPLPRQIVAAVDPFRPEEQIRDLNDRIILTALKLAAQCNAELHLLYAYDVSSMLAAEMGMGMGMGTLPLSRGLSEELRAAQEQAFTGLADRHGVPKECRHFLLGSPIQVISEFAVSSLADVIVMGTVHRRGLHKLLGSTAEHVLYRVPCSILAIKPENAVES
ncbi:universal stress protein [Pseudomonas sp. 2FG]|uniref:universal stress protein n=1 Tax=Pseudomonas sp. 2FG TaxID=2502191 RepID=UPI0010F7E295|nr:universal stress protein [Pseudomonas sp. 2FG]